jgi:hypothetical protein
MKDKQEVIKAWLDTLRTADEALRLAGAGFEHRQNLQAMQHYFNSKLKKAGAAM